jgi:hypothetical protein
LSAKANKVVFHLVRRQLLQHLLVTDPLTESCDNRCIGNTWKSSTHLGEAGDEGSEGFPGLLPHSVEVGLHTMLLVHAGEVYRELRAELTPGLDGSWSEVHEPCPGWPDQGYMKVTCHYGFVTPCRHDGDDVDHMLGLEVPTLDAEPAHAHPLDGDAGILPRTSMVELCP